MIKVIKASTPAEFEKAINAIPTHRQTVVGMKQGVTVHWDSFTVIEGYLYVLVEDYSNSGFPSEKDTISERTKVKGE